MGWGRCGSGRPMAEVVQISGKQLVWAGGRQGERGVSWGGADMEASVTTLCATAPFTSTWVSVKASTVLGWLEPSLAPALAVCAHGAVARPQGLS